MISNDELGKWVIRTRQQLIDLVSDLNESQLNVPILDNVNPTIWELCHATYFKEFWVLRKGAGQKPLIPNVDSLFDSAKIDHESRWRVKIPNKEEALNYVKEVGDRVLELINSEKFNDQIKYYLTYAIFHEDMHTEALTYNRQTLGHPAPKFSHVPSIKIPQVDESFKEDDVKIPGGKFMLGAPRNASFAFDNEKWGHEVDVKPFKISPLAVTEGQFSKFIDDDGYKKEELWSNWGWKWLNSVQAEYPIYWRKEKDEWQRRHFDNWISIEKYKPVVHVTYNEAEAYCNWAKRRLPTETEWEVAASAEPNGNTLSNKKRYNPWGENIATAEQANMAWQAMNTVDVRAHKEGDSALGCRQMLGNTWEWTCTTFTPYPGFVVDMYEDYSQTSFYTRKVVRGGCWALEPKVIWNTWRNYYIPYRNDIFVGFRTCALKS